MSDFERHMRRRRQRGRDVHRADRAVGAFIAWVVVGVIALVLALLIFQSTALVVVVGAVAAIAILWRLLMRSQR
jgi:L-asparagine transporter-like permease